jgi:hypothetical protein
MARTANKVDAFNLNANKDIDINDDSNEISDIEEQPPSTQPPPQPQKRQRKGKEATTTVTTATISNVGKTVKRKKVDSIDSPFEHTLMNLNEVESSDIEHKIQIGIILFQIYSFFMHILLSDKRNGLGVINGNVCFFKYWTKNNEMNFSKIPFEFSPSLMPRIVHGFRLLNEKMKK